MNYLDIWSQFSDTLFKQMKNLIFNAGFDKTFKAKVVSKISAGKYQILYKGKNYTAACDRTLPTDQIVHVCAPQNNWNDLFIL